MSNIKNTISGLPDGVSISHVTLEGKDNKTIRLHLKTPKPDRICPHCGSVHCNINDSGYTRSIRHTPQSRNPCRITVTLRRFRCQVCGKTFMEAPDWIHPTIGITMELFDSIKQDLSDTLSLKSIARINGVTPYLVSKVLFEIQPPQNDQLCEVLCVDDFAGSVCRVDPFTGRIKFEKFLTNIVDFINHKVLDIRPNRIKKDLIRYFMNSYTQAERNRVRYLCCDMGKNYLGLKKCFPNAVICVDNFHIIQRLNDAVDELRCQILSASLQKGDTEAYKRLKHLNHALLTAADHQIQVWKTHYHNKSNRIRIALKQNHQLEVAYAMLQYFHRINRNYISLKSRIRDLNRWIKLFGSYPNTIIQKAVQTIVDHKQYIINSWRYGYSNAVCEGFNNKIKVLKRVSYGMHSFEYLRARVLLACSVNPDRIPVKKKTSNTSFNTTDSWFFSDFPELSEYDTYEHYCSYYPYG